MCTFVDIFVPVGLEPGWVEQDARIRAQHAEILASLGLDNQGAPPASVFGSLIFETLTDLVDTIWFHARNVLGFSGSLFQRQGYGQSRHEIDVADVDEQLPAVEGGFAEGEVRVNVWISWIENGRLYEAWPWVDEELQRLADRKPDATASDTRDSGGDGVPWSSQWDRDVLCYRLASGRRGGWVVGCSGVCRE